MKALKPLLALIAALALCPAALAAPPRTFFAMDTVMTVSADAADAALLADCEAEAHRLEALLSVTDPGSEIARLNADGRAALSKDTRAVLDYALRVAAQTDGALDVTMYPVVRAWGFTTGDYRVPGDDEIAALLKRVGWQKIALDDDGAAVPEGTMVDLGAVAKGYASDRMAALLRAGGVTSALIDLGGNIYCVGAKADGSDWRVGVRDPMQPSQYVGAIACRDCAVITSGCYERFFTGADGTVYGHIFDPATGRPSESDLISATVIGTWGVQCDALSTALYVMGREKAQAFLPTLAGIEAVLIDEYGDFWVTRGLKEAFAPAGEYQGAKVKWIE